MIRLFLGENSRKRGEALDKYLKTLPKTVQVFYLEKENFNRTEFESLYFGAGLFFAKAAIVLSGVMEAENAREFILAHLDQIYASDNEFIFIEGKLAKRELDMFKNAGAKTEIFELEKEKKERFNSFLLANALGSRDRLNLWIYFRQALERGVALEEMIGILFWKAKDMLTKRNFGKFSETELQNFASRVSYLLPEARREGRDDESAMEQFLLEAL